MRDATQGDAHVAYDATGDIECRCNRDERKGVRGSVTHLTVTRARRECKRRQVDGRDQLTVFEHGVALRFVTG